MKNFTRNAWESHEKRMPNSRQSAEAAHQLTALIFSSPSTTLQCPSRSTMPPRSVLQPLPRIFNPLAAPSPRCTLGPWCLHRRSSACLSGLGAINR
jgi:hypothetical protein